MLSSRISERVLESAIRPIEMGRTAFLFVAAARAGHVAAMMYFLIGICRLNGIECWPSSGPWVRGIHRQATIGA